MSGKQLTIIFGELLLRFGYLLFGIGCTRPVWRIVVHRIEVEPRRCSAFREVVEGVTVPDGVQGMPEAVVAEGLQLPVLCDVGQRSQFQRLRIAVDIVQHLRLENEEAAIDPGFVFAHGLFGQVSSGATCEKYYVHCRVLFRPAIPICAG